MSGFGPHLERVRTPWLIDNLVLIYYEFILMNDDRTRLDRNYRSRIIDDGEIIRPKLLEESTKPIKSNHIPTLITFMSNFINNGDIVVSMALVLVIVGLIED